MESHHDYDFEDHDHYNISSNHSYYDEDDYKDLHTVCDKQDVRSFGGIFLPVVYTLALVVGLAGNSMVIFVYMSQKRLRTMTDVFILNLAFADLLLLFTLPFWAADAVNGWEIGVAACKITSALYTTNFSCSMLLLACISVDRYRALTQGSTITHGQSRVNTRRKRVLLCLLVWMAACIFGLPDMVLATVKQYATSNRKACRVAFDTPSMAKAVKATLELLEMSLSFLLPIMVMMFCYCRVGMALSQAATSGVRGGRRWKAFRVLIAVVGVFLLTQLPYNIVKFIKAMDVIFVVVTDCEVSKRLDRANQVTESLALTHCCLNPILYIFIGSSFKEHVLKIAKRFGQTGRRYRQSTEQPTVEISLRQQSQTNANSESEEKDTSTFTI
ncbi:atypical chemokine receptor 4b [Hoplias malabaricus]|uniref:atypical chemokine receptor 4b n=1 Tax=Hoplias malabaricus TaxID=27720 RepID=UPI00346325A0